MPSLYWKLCFVAGGLILSCCRPAVAQDSIYTHWPTVIPTGYDSAKSLQLWFLVDELLAKPTAIPVEEQSSAMSNDQQAAIRTRIPLARIGSPLDIAHAAAFLASDRAARLGT